MEYRIGVAHCSVDVGRKQTSSAMGCEHHSIVFLIDLRTSPLSCAQWLADVGHELLAPSVACIFSHSIPTANYSHQLYFYIC